MYIQNDRFYRMRPLPATMELGVTQQTKVKIDMHEMNGRNTMSHRLLGVAVAGTVLQCKDLEVFTKPVNSLPPSDHNPTRELAPWSPDDVRQKVNQSTAVTVGYKASQIYW